MMATCDLIDLNTQLLKRGRSPAMASPEVVLPVNEIPMVLMLEQLRPNPDNPRTSRNPRYEDIKASIRARGLDSVPKVTKDPDSDDDVFIFSDGGNTRYAILNELWQETQDERYRRIQCIVKPWPGRLRCVIGHLAENDVRGDLSFIEKAFGVMKAKSIHEEQLGREISQRELADLLKSEGYPVHHSNISRMLLAVEHLWPCMPGLLSAGMGRPQIVQLLSLRIAAENAWLTFSQNSTVTPECNFTDVFRATSEMFDEAGFLAFDDFKDELIGALLLAFPDPKYTYDSWLIELDPHEQNRRKLFGAPQTSSSIPPSTYANETDVMKQGRAQIVTPSEHGEDATGDTAILAVKPKEAEKIPVAKASSDAVIVPQHISAQSLDASEPDNATPSCLAFASQGFEPVQDIWHIEPLIDDIEHLQDIAFRLAFELAEISEGIDLREDSTPTGIGFTTHPLSSNDPVYALLASLQNESTNAPLNTLCIGGSTSDASPLFDDVLMVKFLRLIRVIRRLRELQRTMGACS